MLQHGWTLKSLFQVKEAWHNVCFHSYEMSRISKSIVTEIRLVVASVLGWDLELVMAANMYRISLWDDKNVLKLDSGDGCTTLWVY